jgi:gluconolactonase
MKTDGSNGVDSGALSRRTAIATIGTAAGAAALAPAVLAQQPPPVSMPTPNAVLSPTPSVTSTPRRDFNPGAPVSYPDPDIVTIDPAFAPLRVNNTAIQRLFTGGMWDEGPAWCAQGRYLVWSDIPNDRQLRYIEDDGRVTVFRQPSNNSNGNTFDHQGRQLSCEHRGRRVVRYEHDGSVSVIAEYWDGKHLNSPNDVACHIDGSYWFTDPFAGASLYEGMPDAPGGLRNPTGLLNGKIGQPVGSGMLKGELGSNIYRADPSGRVDMLISEQDFGGGGNGITFSPDYKKVYIVSRQVVWSFDISADGRRISNQKQFADFTIDGVRCNTDGIRCDIYGNLWCSSNAGATGIGYSGVTIWNPEGKLLGRIRLPETCSNVCFGGPKRNRLFMTAGQSLYAVYVNTQGAAPG